MVEVFLNDGTSFETPDENLSNVERLLGEKIKDVKYSTTPFEDAINRLAAEQAALWNTQGNENTEAPKKQMGRPKKSAKN